MCNLGDLLIFDMFWFAVLVAIIWGTDRKIKKFIHEVTTK